MLQMRAQLGPRSSPPLRAQPRAMLCSRLTASILKPQGRLFLGVHWKVNFRRALSIDCCWQCDMWACVQVGTCTHVGASNYVQGPRLQLHFLYLFHTAAPSLVPGLQPGGASGAGSAKAQ